ncbi:uncharacterized protein UV8b_05865 [Ustilaginoidea virens]|uniref:Thioredoxin domain-containing protein n=1 Tax=Ustilaginoidea virens TaxID=1159556 RepID=A0A063CAB3_USTVR|nr:uncharacterized protein UV8b_05865 [Ustilaginoidea virens]QUC21622.1 hypothetical protein UV8b_05865 [Ustilaginoidea virens]GAO13589.1 hypothetical protein UVI_02015380 [Ustilaginoidea virens]
MSSRSPRARAATANPIVEIAAASQYDRLVAQKGRLVALFTSYACKPCGFVYPAYYQLASKYRGVVFVQVDVEHHDNEKLRARYGLEQFPVFYFYRGGRKVDECNHCGGEDGKALRARVERLAA